MKKIKILFLIHDLGQGGAEKVLVNLVNNMDRIKFDISVISLFGNGINEQFLKKDIRYRYIWKKEIPGNSKWMKLLTPEQLHKFCIKDKYDIEVAYLEGPVTRIIGGCQNKSTHLVSWVHVEQQTEKYALSSYRGKKEAQKCYRCMKRIIAVSESVKQDFIDVFQWTAGNVSVLYNTNESEKIKTISREKIDIFKKNEFNIISVGSLKPAKGFDRLVRIHAHLRKDGIPIHTYILGKGPQKDELEKLINEYEITDSFTLLGYNTNPYKYIAKADLFVCSSWREGFSTAATESLIVGTPVCTVDVSGMREMLGDNDEYGVIVENNEDALYHAITEMYQKPALLKHYKQQAEIRSYDFSTKKTVMKVEQMFIKLLEEE